MARLPPVPLLDGHARLPGHPHHRRGLRPVRTRRAGPRTVLRQKTRLSRKPDTWRYEWDAEDRLTTVTTPEGTVWRYAYDALGRRISKQSPFETVYFTWDGSILCEQTTEGVTLTWDHAGRRPLAQTERRTDSTDERFFAIVTDLIGTPTELVDESGALAWRTRTTLWGTTTWNRDATAYTPLRFPGQYFDPESGLHYNYFRYYDPESARYLSQDPLGLAPSDNPATYVHNPQTWSDPLGLGPCPDGDGFELEDLGDQWFRSPEGLDYGPGRNDEHRITHVQQHGSEVPGKPKHGVFDTGDKGILETVDEAWSLRDGAVSVNEQGARTTYIIPMGRQVGFNPDEKFISITVEHGNEVITAFPRGWR